MKNWQLSFPILVLAFCFLIGCSVHTSKDENGRDKDVDVRTPFGSVSVHKGSTDVKEIGLPVYPGARPKTGQNEDDANVNISSSMFGLKVVVQKFQSDDSPDKVLGYYQKEMGKYGKVVKCNGGINMGFHHRDKDDPVSCDDNGHDSEYNQELKVGTENNQHVVAIKPSGKGSEFVMVFVRTRDYDKKDTI